MTKSGSRSKNETGDIWRDGSLGFEERMTAAAARLSDNHAGDKKMKNDAMKAIGGNIASLRKAMSLQRKFDQSTVKRVNDLATILMNYGYLSDMTQQDIKRLMAATKNSVGHEDIEASVQKVLDIMIDNQMRNASKTFDKVLSIRGSKVDDKGIEVQGELDPYGQRLMKEFKSSYGMSKEAIDQAIADATNNMSDSNQAVADQAAVEE